MQKFPDLVATGHSPHEALNMLNLRRYCCRRFPLANGTLRLPPVHFQALRVEEADAPEEASESEIVSGRSQTGKR